MDRKIDKQSPLDVSGKYELVKGEHPEGGAEAEGEAVEESGAAALSQQPPTPAKKRAKKVPKPSAPSAAEPATPQHRTASDSSSREPSATRPSPGGLTGLQSVQEVLDQ